MKKCYLQDVFLGKGGNLATANPQLTAPRVSMPPLKRPRGWKGSGDRMMSLPEYQSQTNHWERRTSFFFQACGYIFIEECANFELSVLMLCK